MDTSDAKQKALHNPSGKSFIEIFRAGEKAVAAPAHSSSSKQHPIERRNVFFAYDWWAIIRVDAFELAYGLQAQNCFKSSWNLLVLKFLKELTPTVKVLVLPCLRWISWESRVNPECAPIVNWEYAKLPNAVSAPVSSPVPIPNCQQEYRNKYEKVVDKFMKRYPEQVNLTTHAYSSYKYNYTSLRLRVPVAINAAVP